MSISYLDFLAAYGGSYRTKHLNFALKPDDKRTRNNSRLYVRQKNTRIPAEFIRMEPWEGEYLFMLARHAHLCVIEVGRYRGGSLFLMACANSTVPIYSIDISPQDDAILLMLLAENGVGNNVSVIVGDSQVTRYPEIGKVDLLFIDGDHSYAGCTKDLNNWYGQVVAGGHIVLHDCYNGCEVLDAVVDFSKVHSVRFMTNPYVSSEHWLNPTGSMCHMIKTGSW